MSELECALHHYYPHALAHLLSQGMKLEKASSNLDYARRCAKQYFGSAKCPDDVLGWLLFCASTVDDSGEAEYFPYSEFDNRPLLELLLFSNHACLDKQQRLLVSLSQVFGFSCAQLATQMQLPESKVKHQLGKAQRVLAEQAFVQLPEELSPETLNEIKILLYGIYKRCYEYSAHTQLLRQAVISQSINLCQALVQVQSNHTELYALLALFLGQSAREQARFSKRGELIDLANQDRGQWDRSAINLADHYLSLALKNGLSGPYHYEAAIEALHNQSPTYADTDWTQMLMLYNLLCASSNCADDQLSRIQVLWHSSLNPMLAFEQLEQLRDQRCELDNQGRYHMIKAQLLSAMSENNRAHSELEKALKLSSCAAERKLLIRRLNLKNGASGL
ncbi:DUF6596 domain-containing protein [Agaribacterium haliotis]|uniref:DUF6596 domain-containing protein n=1 Tax=Agaribacterium haliotis TaxID=2013869 RepID=UPI000BB584E5|nr:DUF6596 domain-containing protein [Agaribacterium haliotis]